MQNNGSFSHGYGAPPQQQGYQQDYPQDYSQQQYQHQPYQQDYNQQQPQQYGQQQPQQQYPGYEQNQQYQEDGSQYGYGGRPDEHNAPDYGRQSSFHGSEQGYEDQNRDFNQGEMNDDEDRGIKQFFTNTSVDAYNQEHTEIRKGRVVGAALLTGLVAYGAKKYIDNKKDKQRMNMDQEIGTGYAYGAEQKPGAPFGTTQPGNPYGNPY